MERFAWTGWMASGMAAVALVAGAGCTNERTCVPECPSAYYCDEVTGCVPYPDLSVPGRDLASTDLAHDGCEPPCRYPMAYCSADKTCEACVEDKHCPFGQLCVVVGMIRTCVPGCADDTRCGPASKDGGTTTPCCAGQCVQSDRDASNCGACGHQCRVPHASAACEAGRCMLGACDNGWADCNKAGEDGCEVNLSADADNCGRCAARCQLAHATAGCAHECYIIACADGWSDCNHNPADGCEIDILNDKFHCGRCGNPCPNGKACVAGRCQ